VLVFSKEIYFIPASSLFLSFLISFLFLNSCIFYIFPNIGGSDPGKSDYKKILKRKKTVIHKVFKLADLCYAKVFLLIKHPRGTTIFNSVKDYSWLLPSLVLAGNSLICSKRSTDFFLRTMRRRQRIY
jgi:hypothetical protein